MAKQVLIYGKEIWPYTRAAREAYAREGYEVIYFDVLKNPAKLEEMLKYSQGQRRVPVIVEGQDINIGFRGGSW